MSTPTLTSTAEARRARTVAAHTFLFFGGALWLPTREYDAGQAGEV